MMWLRHELTHKQPEELKEEEDQPVTQCCNVGFINLHFMFVVNVSVMLDASLSLIYSYSISSVILGANLGWRPAMMLCFNLVIYINSFLSVMTAKKFFYLLFRILK